MRSKPFPAFSLLLVMLALSVVPVLAADPQSPPTPAPTSAPPAAEDAAAKAIEARIADLDQQVKVSQEAATEQGARQLGVDLALLQKRTVLLEDIREIFHYHLENLAREAALKKEKAAVLKNVALQKERGVAEPPPYSFPFYEGLLSQLQFYSQREETYALSSSLVRDYLGTYEKELKAAEKKVRLLQDQVADAVNPDAHKRLQFEKEIALLQKELAKESYLSAETYVSIFQTLREIADLEVGMYREQAAWVQKHLDAKDVDLDTYLAALGQKQAKLEARRATYLNALKTKKNTWEKTDKATGETGASRPEELFQERRNWQHTQQTILDNLVHHLSIIRVKEAFWKKRLELLKGGVPQTEMLKWQEDLGKKREQGKKYFNYLGEQNIYLQAQLAALEKRLADPGHAPGVKDLLIDQKMAYSLLIQEVNLTIQTLTELNQLADRFSQELNSKVAQDPWSALWGRLKLSGQRFLDFEIWVIEGQAVTVKKFLEALAFLIIGLLLAKVVLHYLIFPLLEKTVWRQTKAEILQKAVTYVVYTVVFLITLGKLRIPLQSFATLGGGIAIGLGFATQTIIKNFVSGFILLGEKSFGLGDLVEVGGILGNIHDIGSRSTLLRTGENKDILVPNSYFLENTITNWTRRDRRIRAQVTVGVIYGSPVETVRDLLLRAASETDQVLESPHPFVFFNDFGDNALIFDLYFWIEIMGVLGRKRIQSALRFKINELFREAGITIAFPQRDVHLDSQTPLEVRLVEKES